MTRRRPLTPEEYTASLEALCARSEQCSFDIIQKMRRQGFSPQQTSQVLNHLKDFSFVDDARFARAFVADRYRFAHWGRNKIKAALIGRHIPAESIEEALSTIDTRLYADTAFRSIHAKLRSFDPSTPTALVRQKLLRFGLGRGFESSLILKILNSRRLWLDWQ